MPRHLLDIFSIFFFSRHFSIVFLFFLVLACNSKTLQFLFQFFLFCFSYLLLMNYLLLPMTRVAKIRLVSLRTLANVSVYALMVVVPDTSSLFLFNVRMEFKTNQRTFVLETPVHYKSKLCLCQKSFITPIVTIARIYISCNYYEYYFQLFCKYIYSLSMIIYL